MADISGFGPSDIIGQVGASIDDLAALLASIVDQIISLIFDVLIFLGQVISDIIIYFTQTLQASMAYDDVLQNAFLGGAFSKLVASLLAHLQALSSLIINGVILKIWNLLNGILDRLRKFFKPLIDFLRKMKAIQDAYFNLYIRPIFDFIQRLRRILVVFRLFHFKWAAKLDQDLAGIEAKIAAQFLAAQRQINALTDWITLITDPFGLYQPGIFVASAVRSIYDLYNALWGAQTVGLASYPTTDQQTDATRYTRTASFASIHLTATAGLQPDDQSRIAQLRTALTALGYTV